MMGTDQRTAAADGGLTPTSEPLDADCRLYVALGTLAKKLDVAYRRLQDLEAPLAATSTQIPQASDHLTDLTALTEQGTHRVMALTEAIQDNRVHLEAMLARLADAMAASGCTQSLLDQVKALQPVLAEDDKRLVDIMTALSFQDLVAQRVRKLVTILNDVHHKLVEMVVVFGVDGLPDGAGKEGRANEMLHQLDASRATSLKQGVVDDILAEFGFS
jgi:chemotaxis protein CheZ